jgi:hypothetical protein
MVSRGDRGIYSVRLEVIYCMGGVNGTFGVSNTGRDYTIWTLIARYRRPKSQIISTVDILRTPIYFHPLPNKPTPA